MPVKSGIEFEGSDVNLRDVRGERAGTHGGTQFELGSGQELQFNSSEYFHHIQMLMEVGKLEVEGPWGEGFKWPRGSPTRPAWAACSWSM